MRTHRLIARVGLLLALVGCGPSATDRVDVRPATDTETATATATATATVTGSADCAAGTSQADWVPFVQHAGVYYQHGTPSTTVPEDQLGAVVGTVTCQRSTSTRDADEPARDGDAAYLPVGTPLRALTGVDPTLRLAVRSEDGGWQVYDADDVPDATRGEQLLDLREVVRVSLVESWEGEDVVRSVTDPDDVARLVAAVRSAPLVSRDETHRAVRGSLWFVRFELAHGPLVQKGWYPEGGVLFPRIAAPPLLRELLQV